MDNGLMKVQRQKRLLPHCETTYKNSDCPYIPKGCIGCMHPKNKAIQKSMLAGFQALQFKVAEMYQKVETSRLLTWKSTPDKEVVLYGSAEAARYNTSERERLRKKRLKTFRNL